MFDRYVIVCRPAQLSEAAAVLSCLPSNGFPPLVVVSRPPLTVAKYNEIAQAAGDARRASMLSIRTTMASRSLGDPEVAKANFRKIVEHQRLQVELTPLRSWRAKNRRYFRVLSQLADTSQKNTAIFLFAPDDDDLRISEPDGTEADDSIIPRKWRKIYFLSDQDNLKLAGRSELYVYDNLNTLVHLAWKRLQSKAANHYIEIPADSISSVYVGLARALAERVPLKFVAPNEREFDLQDSFSPQGPDADEVVLVESVADAEYLAGVLYARERGAPLICAPPPNLDKITGAIQEINIALGGQSATTIEDMVFLASSPEASDSLSRKKNLFDWVPGVARAFGFSSVKGSIRKLEIATSAHLSENLLETIGSRRVTALTVGAPYNFIKVGKYDWSKKPIGHLSGDVSLNLMTEIYGNHKNDVSFNLVLDPGYFQTEETKNVTEELGAHGGHSIVLSGEAANSSSLMFLARVLPVEMIFFNTHGSDSAILLGDGYPLYSHLIVQWVYFNSAPLVINNSCLSWTGVGKEFLRVGARGYIGTLWSIDANSAAEFARQILQRIISQKATISTAVSSFEGAGVDTRAYIFSGSVNARLPFFPPQFNAESENSLRYARHLAAALVQVPHDSADIEPVAMVLVKELQHFLSPLSKRPPSAEALLEIQELQMAVWAAQHEPLIDPAVCDEAAQQLFATY
ncbi:CHAT domain-containing protein [Rhizobium indicum]|uniref:CHAT domain-containing protein n=1 Tax=Rhizobium indicum TaxID=2583231 RepID=UPI001106C334|nr:CHAT domain-containing protein [Rhizobium indicum]QKK30511.1 CHAT domain-containing protein [Rhizobium indicum]